MFGSPNRTHFPPTIFANFLFGPGEHPLRRLTLLRLRVVRRFDRVFFLPPPFTERSFLLVVLFVPLLRICGVRRLRLGELLRLRRRLGALRRLLQLPFECRRVPGTRSYPGQQGIEGVVRALSFAIIIIFSQIK